MQYEIKPISNFPGYFISNYGEVFSKFKNKIGYNEKNRMKLLKGSLRSGYLRVGLYKNNKKFSLGVNRLVLETFECKMLKPFVACHNDNNPLNNRLDNLRWDTHKGNYKDRYENGTAGIGEKHSQAILNEKQVRVIKYAYSFGSTLKTLAYIFNVHISTIQAITSGKNWKHVKINN